MTTIGIMPVPIFIDNDGGGDLNAALALFISLNIFLAVWLIIKIVNYFRNEHFRFGSFKDDLIESMWFGMFCTVNGLALLMTVSFVIYNWII